MQEIKVTVCVNQHKTNMILHVCYSNILLHVYCLTSDITRDMLYSSRL